MNSLQVNLVNCCEEHLLFCPVCGGTYIHAIGAYTRLGSDKFEAGVYEGTRVRSTTGERRSALVVEFNCEQGHDFEIAFQQHKGETFLTATEKIRESREGIARDLADFEEEEVEQLLSRVALLRAAAREAEKAERLKARNGGDK